MRTPNLSRRRFLERTGGLAGAALLGDLPLSAATDSDQNQGGRSDEHNIAVLVRDPDDRTAAAPSVQWAVGQLREALAARGWRLTLRQRLGEVAAEEFCIVAGSLTTALPRELLAKVPCTPPQGPEALVLLTGQANQRSVLFAGGSDAQGLTYALLELADRLAYTEEPRAALAFPQPVIEQAANRIRSVARLFASDVEDKAWFHDRSFWPPYLTELARQRFNRFSLTLGLGYDFTRQIRDAYLHFAYPFLLAVPGYAVRAVGLPDAERARNLDMLRFVSEEAAKRGLHFQLGLWTHAYQWVDSPQANYTIEGLDAANHAAYCRAALKMLLQACPAIGGVTLRIHGESGVAEGSYDFWKTVFAGIVQSGRTVEIDLHAKGIDARMIELALATEMPVRVSPKYWAEHMGLPYQAASIRALEMPPRNRQDDGFFAQSNGSRRFLRYSYGDLLAEGRRYGVYFRMWPGTQRLLLWGDPAMAAAYGRASSFCGSLGAEICEPLSFKGRKGSGLPGNRTAYADASLRPGSDWEKYRYTYRLWGRLLYQPDTEPASWQAYLRKQFGPGAAAAEAALSQASRILPLATTAHLPSAANNNYWPENYTNMAIVDATAPHPYGDTPSPKRFGTVSPLDPVLFSRIDDFAAELWKGEPSSKYSPLDVAHWLQGLVDAARTALTEADRQMAERRRQPEWRRWAADIALQTGLGQFFAHKLRAGVLYALHERSQDRGLLEEALKWYRAARTAWAELAERATMVYVTDITFGPERYQRGHWRDRLAAIDQDLAQMAQRLANPAQETRPLSEGERQKIQKALGLLQSSTPRPALSCRHEPPASFQPGQPLALELIIESARSPARPTSVRMHYRHVNQGETYRTESLRAQAERWQASIPGSATLSPYPLQYFFELQDDQGRAGLYPGFAANLCNQPYFVVRQGS